MQVYRLPSRQVKVLCEDISVQYLLMDRLGAPGLYGTDRVDDVGHLLSQDAIGCISIY